MKLKNFKKLIAFVLTFTLMLATLVGCGDNNTKNDDKKTGKENSGSFAEVMLKTCDLEKYSFNMDFDFAISAKELEDAVTTTSSGDRLADAFQMLGITGDTIKGTLSFEGKANENDDFSAIISVKLGNISGEVTEVIYTGDKLYISISKTVEFVKSLAKKFGAEALLEESLAAIPDKDYVELSVEDAANAVLVTGNEYVEALENIDKEELKATIKFVLEEVEKIAKKADGYSEDNGYTLTINKDNVYDWVKNGIDVVVSDIDKLYEKLEATVGEELSSEISKEDIEKIKEQYSEIDDEKWNELKESLEDELKDISQLELKFNASQEGNSVQLSIGTIIGMDSDKVDIAIKCKFTPEDSVEITAPDSVITEKEVNELMSKRINQDYT